MMMRGTLLFFFLSVPIFVVIPLRIDDKQDLLSPKPHPSWVDRAISKQPFLKYPQSQSVHCSQLGIPNDNQKRGKNKIPLLPGRFCFSMKWRDISRLKQHWDPRRRVCPSLAVSYDSQFTQQVCLDHNHELSTCLGNSGVSWLDIGAYIPHECPQYPCEDWQWLRKGITQHPSRQLVSHRSFESDINLFSQVTSIEKVFNLSYPSDKQLMNQGKEYFPFLLGYIQTHKRDPQNRTLRYPIIVDGQCPINTTGLTLFYDEKNLYPCTITSSSFSSSFNGHSSSSSSLLKNKEKHKFFDEKCKKNAQYIQFLGCVPINKEQCLNKLSNEMDYLEIPDPSKVEIQFDLFYEWYSGVSETGITLDQTILMQWENDQIPPPMISQSLSIDEYFKKERKKVEKYGHMSIQHLKLGLMEPIIMKFEDISNEQSSEICTSQLGNLASHIPDAPEDLALTLCVSMQGWRTYMAQVSDLWYTFIPSFIIQSTLQSNPNSFGISGRIQYRLPRVFSHVNLTSVVDFSPPNMTVYRRSSTMMNDDQQCIMHNINDDRCVKTGQWGITDAYIPKHWIIIVLLIYLMLKTLMIIRSYLSLKKTEDDYAESQREWEQESEQYWAKHSEWIRQQDLKELEYSRRIEQYQQRKEAHKLAALSIEERLDALKYGYDHRGYYYSALRHRSHEGEESEEEESESELMWGFINDSKERQREQRRVRECELKAMKQPQKNVMGRMISWFGLNNAYVMRDFNMIQDEMKEKNRRLLE